ncbi:suppressor of glycerol defect [Thecaphora frezii]
MSACGVADLTPTTATATASALPSSSSPLSSGLPSKPTAQLSSRSKFMLERLADLKNNRSAKAGSNDPSDPSSPAGQLLTRMKKFLGGMGKKRTVRANDPLRISLKDLKDTNKKGKCWLVGSVWKGQTDQADAQGLTKLLPMNASAKSIQA